MNAIYVKAARLGLILGVSMACAGARAAGIPEPSVVFYGTIRNTAVENIRMTAGTLSWHFREVASGWSATFTTPITNLLDQFSYVLEVPCEQVVSASLSSNALNLTGTSILFDCAQASVNGVPVTFANPGQTNITLSARDRGRMVHVDLDIVAPCTDIDMNGLCDEWELQYVGYIGVDPNADFDGDGRTNWEEYKAGTDPLDPNSVFQFLTIQKLDAARTQVQWQSADGRHYSLYQFGSLTSTNFSVVQSNILATTSTASWVVTNTGPERVYFYRLQLEP
jgi:hypothetical protein